MLHLLGITYGWVTLFREFVKAYWIRNNIDLAHGDASLSISFRTIRPKKKKEKPTSGNVKNAIHDSFSTFYLQIVCNVLKVLFSRDAALAAEANRARRFPTAGRVSNYLVVV